jgi:hypothetical protein
MIKDDKFNSSILDTIKENKIKPKARWTFLLKDYVVWIFGLISLVLGSFSVAIIIYLLKNNDWNIYHEFSGSLFEFVTLVIPYFWILLLFIFILLINYNIKHTKKGYKFTWPVLVGATVIASAVCGTLFFGVGLGRTLDDVLGEHVSFYDRVMNPRVIIWNQPGKGRLGGLLVSELGDKQYQLIDVDHNIWVIDTVELEDEISDLLQIDHPVRLIGERKDEFYFMIKNVFQGNGPCRAMMRSHLRDTLDRGLRAQKGCDSDIGICERFGHPE